MPLPEPTAEELAYGRWQAQIHGYRAHDGVFGAGYALGRKQAETAPPSPDAPPPPPPAGRRAEPALTADQQIRIAALTFAASITRGVPAPTVRDLEEIMVGVAERLAEWIATGDYHRITDDSGLNDPGAIEFGPGVACTCGPDSVTHVHEDPWGCTTCGCRFYVAFVAPETEPVSAEDIASIARTMEGIRFTPVDIPLADVETPEQSAAIVDSNLRAMGLTIDELRTAVGDAYRQAADEFRTTAAPCGCRAYDPNLNHHTAAEHTNCGPGLPCGGCDSCISDRAYHVDRLAKETGDA
jgi:hypothetical protein